MREIKHSQLTNLPRYITRCAYAQGRVKRLSPSIDHFGVAIGENRFSHR